MIRTLSPALSGLLLLAALSFTAQAKTLPNTEKIEQTAEFFMEQVLAGETESAYSLISAYLGVNLETFLERGTKTAQDLKQLESKTGKPLSYALLKTQNVGSHFYKITYLLKYKTAALVWELNFYQPDKGWLLVDVTFNGDINALFE
ncbi:MAG: hypothetical protein C9356_04845 [Oleiphilus sp.]|nr:MAG: hypothetical protein C9356_04845 [Oleiphilus sp.]